MRMVSPDLPYPQVTIAEEQEEYKPVTGALLMNPGYGAHPGARHNTVVCAYRLSDEERRVIAEGGDLYLAFLTFGGALTPHSVFAGNQAVMDAYGIPEATP